MRQVSVTELREFQGDNEPAANDRRAPKIIQSPTRLKNATSAGINRIKMVMRAK